MFFSCNDTIYRELAQIRQTWIWQVTEITINETK